MSFPLLATRGNNTLLDKGPPNAAGAAVADLITFSEPITAFGAYFANAGDATTANTIVWMLENTSLGTSKEVAVGTFGPSAQYSNVAFFGVTDTDPFDRVSIRESFDYDGVLLDDITAGQLAAVPEAETFLLVATGAGAFIIARNRRRVAYNMSPFQRTKPSMAKYSGRPSLS